MGEPIIRKANHLDDLSDVYPDGSGLLAWNIDNLFVAVDEGKVVGAILFWDSGHPVVYVGHFRVCEERRGAYIGYRLMEAVETWARKHNKLALVGLADEPSYIELARSLGATVSDHPFYLLTRVFV